MKFLNIFNKNKEQAPEEPATIAAITYSIDESGEMFIDINIEDFKEAPLDGLSSLIAILATPKSQIVTIDMIKRSFIKEGMDQEYLKLIKDAACKASEYLKDSEDQEEDINQDQPYIKPSDMF